MSRRQALALAAAAPDVLERLAAWLRTPIRAVVGAGACWTAASLRALTAVIANVVKQSRGSGSEQGP